MFDFLREAWFLYLVATAALAWVLFAEHPTAKNLRAAIGDTLGL